MENNIDIKYLNKDFSTFKRDLIEYAKAYYPTVYTDFTKASPGTLFIDMASYVGDVLSFYLDNQIQETFLPYAKQKSNLFALAYTLGYRPKVVSSAIVNLEVYQIVPAVTIAGLKYPDFSYAMIVNPGMVIASNQSSNVTFYAPSKVDFTSSSSLDDTDVTIYETDGTGAPVNYLLRKYTTAISGKVRSATFNFGAAQRFSTITINDTDIVSVLSIVDSSNNTWYEVPYLAQDYIYNPVANTAQSYPDLHQYANQVPYVLEKVRVDRRFTTRFTDTNQLVIEFGSGVNSVADDTIIPNPASVGLGLTSGSTTINTAFDPTNFVTTTTYGLAPYNTTLTVTYLAGGGAEYNVRAGELTKLVNYGVSGNPAQENTLITNNSEPASGGADGDTIEDLRLNIRNAFSSQMRAITQQDYIEKTLNMPPKYGKISKVYMSKDASTFANYERSYSQMKDPSSISMYVLSLDNQGNLDYPTPALLQNLSTHLSEYRSMTDSIDLKTAYIINIACSFDIVIRPNFNSQDVLARCITSLTNYFNIDNWQINEPIMLGDVYSQLDLVEGVQMVKHVKIVNKQGEELGYSRYAYDIEGATINNVIYPSLDPSIFELKFPNTNIQGRVVTF